MKLYLCVLLWISYFHALAGMMGHKNESSISSLNGMQTVNKDERFERLHFSQSVKPKESVDVDSALREIHEERMIPIPVKQRVYALRQNHGQDNINKNTPSILSGDPTPLQPIPVQISLDEPVFTVEQEFLSFNIDFEMFYYDKDPWIRFNMTSPRLVTILRGLSPGLWRIGGTDSAHAYFDVSDHLSSAHLKPRSLVMTKQLLTQFIRATEQSGTRFLYDLNLMLRFWDQYNPSDAIKMLDFIASQGWGKNLDFELGNEPTGYPMSPSRIADDFVMLHDVIRSYPNLNGSRIVGPDSVGLDIGSKGYQVMNAVANKTGHFLKAITFHQYYFNSKEVTYKDYINPKYFSVLNSDIGKAKHAVQHSAYPNLPIWIGETADGWNRGSPGVSDRYVNGFLWLDKLGLSARLGVGVVMRQTLRHGDYQMLSDYLEPNPDYWLSYVHKQLVGTRVLDVVVNGTSVNSIPSPHHISSPHHNHSSNPPPTTRVYAHCTRMSDGVLTPRYPPGAVTVFGLNVSPNTTSSLVLPSSWTHLTSDLYLLTPSNLDLLSKNVLLNGKVMTLPNDLQLPPLVPQTLQPGQPFNLPPLTFGFLVVPQAKAKACL